MHILIACSKGARLRLKCTVIQPNNLSCLANVLFHDNIAILNQYYAINISIAITG